MVLQLKPDQFLGDTRERRAVADLSLSEVAFPRPMGLPLHIHVRPYFCLVLSGEFHERVGRVDYQARRGTLVFHPTRETHSDQIQSHDTSLFNVTLGPSWERRLDELPLPARPAPGPQGPRTANIALDLWRQLRIGDCISRLAIEGLVLSLLAETSRCRGVPARSRPAWLSNVLDFIHAHFRDDFDYDALVRVAGVHPTHLARTFGRHVGCTATTYVRRLRVDWVRERLRGETPLAALALEAGFADQSHLTRAFHREIGVPPSRYRRLRSGR